MEWKMKQTILLLILFQLNVSSRHLSDPQIQDEKEALLAFKGSVSSDPAGVLDSWTVSNHVCNFSGVECNGPPLHVVELRLNSCQLHAHLSPRLANLTALLRLDLSDNMLYGQVPLELGSLHDLTEIELSRNDLTGQVPGSIGNLSNLFYLDLGSNNLTGNIPSSLFNSISLALMDLSDNKLSGQIPSNVGRATELRFLQLSSNDLVGGIPISLSNLSYLLSFDISHNHLSGELPSGIFTKMSELQVLHLSYNNLTSHDNNTNLAPFFSSLSNCTSLKELKMGSNGLGGHLPRQMGSILRNVTILLLNDNNIYGPIPPSLVEMDSLNLVDMSNNLLGGNIPKEIGLLPRLERLFLFNNYINGKIPPELGNSTSIIGILDVSHNRLYGKIPKSLGNLSQMNYLLLNNNRLSGMIPPELGNFMNLYKLDLSYNKLEGRIPGEVAGAAKLSLNLSNNRFEGNLPTEIGRMDTVVDIDLSHNNLTGTVISQLSRCAALKFLNLSYNSLYGPLPSSIGELQNLENLDVSYNLLTGEIPLSILSCLKLKKMNLSYNDFNGSIPTGGIFSTFNDLSFLGNPHLCGSASLPVCSIRTRGRRSWIHGVKFLMTVCIVSSMLAFLLTFLCVIGVRKAKHVIHRKSTKSDDQEHGDSEFVLKSGHPRITHKQLVEATNGFNQNHLIGTGSYGRVYRGTLNDGSDVAVKVLQLQTRNSTKSFKRECQVLKGIRHRNLIRIITSCSLPDFKAIVLPFMANGSLESHLHQGSSELSLVQRVNICSDVAEGMAYLHHHSPVRVVHCDLKPSNVLLNDDLTALVSDFGISRLVVSVGAGGSVALGLGGDDTIGSSTTNLVCGSLGYIAPEYGFGSSASTKGDVYSFGILILEMVTRRRPTDEMFGGGLNLHQWVKNHPHESIEMIVDPLLMRAAQNQTLEIKRMWEVALRELTELGLVCTQVDPSTRPTMHEAAYDLGRLKRYLTDGDTTATFTSSHGISSSTFGED